MRFDWFREAQPTTDDTDARAIIAPVQRECDVTAAPRPAVPAWSLMVEFRGNVGAHALDGWRFEGDQQRWFLSKRFGRLTAHIRGTAAKACAWNIIQSDRNRSVVLAADSASDTDSAKIAVAHWIRDHA